ncbi:MAG: hypothetical protein HY749_22605 [Gammaproteobacteria bacterium]|nr:hypothetical protein [Gammaproteobacteria bacterium]MBI5615173.1 hypothetical protein [Gammaproteobacteria bacterium]
MSCSMCVLKLRDLLAALLPLGNLGTIPLPPALGQLNAYTNSLTGPLASTMSFNPKLALSLPPLPISLNLVEQISATATAIETLTANLGFSPCAPGGASRLSLSMTPLKLSLAALLPLLPLMPHLATLTSLSLALRCVATLRARLGVDLLIPKVALSVNAALGLPGAAAAPLSPVAMRAAARAAAYAKLAAAAAIFGGPLQLLPTLRLAAQIRMPQMPGNLNLLALLAALLGLRANLLALGISNLSVGAIADLRLQLKPLLTLPPLALNATGLAGASTLPMLNANFMLSAQAIAGLNLAALANLRLPNLAPLTLIASVASSGGLSSPAACSRCPVG